MFEFTIFRIPVRVEPWFLLIMGLFGASGRGFSSRSDILFVLIFILAAFFSILVHELGHALTGRKFGARDTQIVLHGMGGVAIFPHARFTRLQSFLVTFAGPATQIVLGVIAWSLSGHFGHVEGLKQFIEALAFVSIFWAILNCIPVWPLDGGQMLGAVLGPSKTRLTHQVGLITGIAVGVLALLYTRSLFAPILFGFLAYQNYQMLQQYGKWR